MKEKTVNKVAELYKEKSELLGELSDLTNSDEYSFEVCRTHRGSFHGYYPYNTLSNSFLAEIKELTVNHIKQQIEDLNKELELL